MTLEGKNGMLTLEALAQNNAGQIRQNLATPMLYEEIVKNREGHLSFRGPIVVRTGQYTEQTEDKYIVEEPSSSDKIWWGPANKPLSPARFEALWQRLLAYLQNKDLYVQEGFLGGNPAHRFALRVISERAWHSLFARNLLYPLDLFPPPSQHHSPPSQHHSPPSPDSSSSPDSQQPSPSSSSSSASSSPPDSSSSASSSFVPDWTIFHVPGFHAQPQLDGTRSPAFSATHLTQRLTLIGGTSYAGELKQTLFALTHLLVPQQQTLSLRCAANIGSEGDVALFLGRSGSGKTALATSPGRRMIGDDHHGWSDQGIFTYERGCYASVWNLTPHDEPLIYKSTQTFGTVLENAYLDQRTRRLHLADRSLSKNVRAAYPLASPDPQSSPPLLLSHPRHLFVLTCDPFGVLPPLARLSPAQATFAFLSSYKPDLFADDDSRQERVLAHSCFDAAPLLLSPQQYARLLLDRLTQHQVQCWLLNTGWNGEPFAQQNPRIPLASSRILVDAVLAGHFAEVPFEPDPIFQFELPQNCPGLPPEFLNPRLAAEDEGEYEVRANRLATEFIADFEQFKEEMPPVIHEMLDKIVLLEESLDLMEKFTFSM